MSDGHGHRRFAHASGTYDGDKPLGDYIRCDRSHYLIAANHPAKDGRQDKPLPGGTTRIFWKSRRRTCNRFAPHGRYEAVTLPRNIGDVPVVAFAIPEHSAQTGDVDPEIARVHD